MGLMHPDDRGASARAWMHAIERPGGRAESHGRIAGPDGAWTKVLLTFINAFDHPEIRAMLILSEDLGEATGVEARPSSAARFLAPAWSVQRLDLAGIVLSVDGMVEDIFGVGGDELLGVSALKWIHPDDHGAILAMWVEVIATPGDTRTSRHRILRPDGSTAWVEGTVVNRSEEEGIVLAIVHDITAQLAEEDALRSSQAELRALAEHLPAAVFRAGLDGRITFANSHLLRLLGTEVPPALVTDLGEVDDPTIRDALAGLVDEGRSASHAVTDFDSADGARTMRISWRRVAADDSRSHAVLGVLEDVTGTALLRHNAEHDPLTGLWNRRTLEERLVSRLRTGAVTVVFLDLDGFKPVNDRLGHAAGDQVLVEVARRIQSLVRSHDGAARWGGDEFVLMLQHQDLRGAGDTERFEDQVRARISNAFADPIVLEGGTWNPCASIGIVTASRGEDSAAVLTAADEAMYRNKRQR